MAILHELDLLKVPHDDPAVTELVLQGHDVIYSLARSMFIGLYGENLFEERFLKNPDTGKHDLSETHCRICDEVIPDFSRKTYGRDRHWPQRVMRHLASHIVYKQREQELTWQARLTEVLLSFTDIELTKELIRVFPSFYSSAVTHIEYADGDNTTSDVVWVRCSLCDARLEVHKNSASVPDALSTGVRRHLGFHIIHAKYIDAHKKVNNDPR